MYCIIAHEQKAYGLKSIGMANKKTQYLRCSWVSPNDLKHNEGSFFSPALTISLNLQVVQMSEYGYLAIFVTTKTDNRQTDKTNCFTPCACARGNDGCGIDYGNSLRA